MLQPEQVAEHDSAESLWVIVEGHAYDLTEFAPEHPGGYAPRPSGNPSAQAGKLADGECGC